MVVTDSSHDTLFGDIKGEAGRNFEKGFKHGDWPDPFPGLFAEGFDETPGPDFECLVGYPARGPGYRPEAHCLGAIGSFQKSGEVSVSPSGVARVGSFLEGAEAFVDFGSGDAVSELGC